MNPAFATFETGLDTSTPMPSWIAGQRAETLEHAAFLSGGALTCLHLALARAAVPHPLLRDRLAMGAAAACTGFAGRPESVAGLRDAIHLLRPGDLPGPAGEICQSWRRAVQRPISINALQRSCPDIDPGTIAGWIGAGSGAPVKRAAQVLEAVLADAPRGEIPALILADAALARALGWKHHVPLLAAGLKRADTRKRGESLAMACHRAVTVSALEAVRLASQLARRAAGLKAIAPKLRARGAEEAVAIFLTRDAVAPSALPLRDRAARRLCDRLVGFGVVRELTGRDTFRLYGV